MNGRLNMNKCKIAILDSGYSTFQIDKYNIVRLKNFISSDESCLDDNGHGTAILEIVGRVQPNAEYTIIKVLDDNAESKITIIIQALEYLLGLSVDYVCMSFSTHLDYEIVKMYSLWQKLKRQGKILVSSKANSGKKSYPAEFDNVIGVEGVVFENPDEFWYIPERDIQVIANVLPIMVPTRDGKQWIMFGGNSKAAAQVCRNIASSSLKPEEFLLNNRYKEKWSNNEIQKRKVYNVTSHPNQNYSDELFKQICDALEEYKEGLSKEKNLHSFFSASDYYNILVQIEEKTDLKINYIDMEYKDFDTVWTLYEKLYRISILLNKGEESI